jgi:hypothetical protein
VKSTAGYLSSSEQTLTFGLGGFARVDRLTVTWPTGQTDTLTDVPANQTLTVTEGQPKR